MEVPTGFNKAGFWIDRVILLFLGVLIFVLPIAHTVTIRALAFYIPLFLLMIKYYLTRDFKWISTSFEWPFLAFFIVVLASLPTALNFSGSLKEIRAEVVIPILYFYTAYYALRGERDGAILLKILLFGSLMFSIYSLYEFHVHKGTWLEATYRVSGVKGAIEASGLYHVMVIPFLFWGLFYFRKSWQRLCLVGLLTANLLALHVTFTRAAYFALGMQAVCITGLLLIKRRWVLSISIIVIIGLIGTFYVEKKLFRELQTGGIPSIEVYLQLKPKEIAGLSSNPMTERLTMWRIAIDEIAKNPFYPHGFGRFSFSEAVHNESNRHLLTYPHVHNTFIGMAFELGMQGLIVFLWMIGTFFMLIFKKWYKSTDSFSTFISASLLTMMFGYWVSNFFQNMDADDPKLLFMLLLGIGMAVLHRIPKEQEEQKKL